MRWKQFFTPVKSLNADEAHRYMDQKPGDSFTLLDVRQPEEYASGHIPGAKLIPLPELNERLSEIDPTKPTVVY
jgi:rhodanese-related sulfurtransferase